MDSLLPVQCLFVLALTLAAMITDLRARRIPNWLTVSGLATGLVFHLGTAGWHGLLQSLGGFLVGFGVLLVLWLIGGGGGGDVKLMGALGAWIGAPAVVMVFLLSALMALVCLIAMAGWSLVSPTIATATVPDGQVVAGKKQPLFRMTIPYAVPAGLAAWTVMLARLLVATGNS